MKTMQSNVLEDDLLEDQEDSSLQVYLVYVPRRALNTLNSMCRSHDLL